MAQEITQGPLRAVSPGQRQERPTALKTPSLKSMCFRRFVLIFQVLIRHKSSKLPKKNGCMV